MRRLVLAAAVLAFAAPAHGAGEADGIWSCTLPSGTAMGTMEFSDGNYAYTSTGGDSGQGGILYQDGALYPSFVIIDGPAVFRGLLGGSVDNGRLALVSITGDVATCVRS